MNLDRILASAPVNGTAAAVTSARRGSIPAGDLTREELIAINERLQRKHRLLKHVLRITSKAQHVNLMSAIKRHKPGPGVGMARLVGNKRAALEYKRVGEEMQRMNRALQEMRSAKSGKRAEQHGWRQTA
jgi:hypothetical protein